MLRADPTYCSLLSSVIQTPGDDLPRLVLADFLEENGYDERSEFIRLQLEIAKSGLPVSSELLARERELWAYSRDDLYECNSDVFLAQSWAVEKHWEGWKGNCLFIITRGFISHARVPLSTWFREIEKADQYRMLRWHPVENLEIIDAEPVQASRNSDNWIILELSGYAGSFPSRQAALDHLNEICLRSLKADQLYGQRP